MNEEVIALMCQKCGGTDCPYKEEEAIKHACAAKSGGNELTPEDIDLINSMVCMDCPEFTPEIW